LYIRDSPVINILEVYVNLKRKDAKTDKKDGRINKNAEKKENSPSKSSKSILTIGRIHVFILILLNFLIFANTFNNEFTYDDREYIERNVHIQRPEKLTSLFTHAYPPHKPYLGLYRPIVELTYLIDWCSSLRSSDFSRLKFKDQVSMPVFHFTNILIHIGVVLLLYALIFQIFKSNIIALISALVFSVHPVHVEVVTSLVGRAESLCAIFFLFSLLLFVIERQKMREKLFTPLYLFSCLSFFAALLSKESAITLPPVIIITDWFLWMKNRNKDEKIHYTLFLKNAVIRMLPYVAVFVFYMIIRLNILGSVGISRSHWYFKSVSTSVRLASMCIGALVYLRLFLLPVSMSIDYNFPVRVLGPFWAEQPDSFFSPWVFLGVAFIIIYIYFTVISIIRKKDFAFPLLFFPISMFPFMNIMPFGDFIAERFLYLPSIAYCLFLGILFARFWNSKKNRVLIIAAISCLLLFYSVRTIIRNSSWKSGLDLLIAEGKNNPENPNLLSGLGGEYSKAREKNLIKGNAWRHLGDFKKSAEHLELARKYEDLAIESFEKAIKKDPKDFLSYYNYGAMCVEMRNPDINRAEDILLKGAACMPENIRSLHVFYYYLGVINMKKTPPDIERALFFFKKAHRLKRSELMVILKMASIYGVMGEYGKAHELLKDVLSRNPARREAVKMLKILRKSLLNQEKNK
jgi:protein O-mannosyl-transferase